MMQALRSVALSISIAALLSAAFFVRSASAHKGAGEPLFVAEDGTDSGRCLDEASPCRTLGYALSVAGKGAEIRMAEGTYAVEDPEDLFHVVSGMIEVSGGFKRSGSRFTARNGLSTLTGVMLVQMTVAEAAGRLLASGDRPPVYVSANVHGGLESNLNLEKRYAGCIRRTAS